MISVIIPTYKSPDALDLCLESAIKGQNHSNEIIVVVDGYFEINREVITKHADNISVLDLIENNGTCRAINMGVYNATNEIVLITNDDNVFPKDWDTNIMAAMDKNSVLSPNQIEPYESMFRQFIIKDLGRNPSEFNLHDFWDYEKLVRKNKKDDSGSTFPICISKLDFLRVGGFDDRYPSLAGFVADWDFFLKCELSGMKMVRTYATNFYHFVSVSSKSKTQTEEAKRHEYNCHQYFRYKWGQYAEHNPNTNSKLISKYKF